MSAVTTKSIVPQGARPTLQPQDELMTALSACRSAIVGLAVASALINVLYLTGSFYMLEIYDRVLPSRSVPTLVGLSILALALFGFQGVLDSCAAGSWSASAVRWARA
jgi:ABC-type protease/lipase transport system fused ATPase/permease subunit